MRRFGMIFVMGALTALLAACGGSATPSPSATTAAAPSAAATTAASQAAAASSGAGASGGGGAALSCATAPSGSAATVNVTIQNFQYSPQPVQAKVGDVVAWTNKDSAPHSATMDDGSCDTDTINASATAMLVFNAPGTYTYHCKIHPGQMKDVTVVVQ
jgi:plastocyanin